MNFLEAFRTAWSSLVANKLRTLLTLLGMIIGVFAIIASVTAVDVIDVYFKESINLLGSNTFSISRHPAVRMNDGPRQFRRPVTYAQMEQLERSLEVPSIVCPIEWFDMGAVRFGERETEPNVDIMGSDEDYPENYSYEVAEGRSLTGADVQYARSVIVLGSAIAKELFPNESPLGKQITFKGHKYEVVGVFAEKGSFLGQSWDNQMVAPITTMFYVYGRPDRDILISVRVSDATLLPAAMEQSIGHMRRIRKVDPGKENDFELSTNDSIQDVFETFTGALTIGGAGIGGIALLAAGIGIMNIMLVSVTERTREIGIRKSVGARRGDIMRQFLLEAFFLCQIGGFIGIVLGALTGNIVALQFNITAAFPMDWAIAGFVVTTAISVLFGVYPAWKAAGLDPIESLRHE